MASRMSRLSRRVRRDCRRAFKASVQAWRQRAVGSQPRRCAFVVGAQRSGTNMVMNLLQRSYETTVFHETDRRAFDEYLMRDPEVIQALIDEAPAPLVAIKALCEMDRLFWLMARFSPARTVWVFRHYDDAVNSSLISFSQVADQVGRLVEDRDSHLWIGRGMSELTHSRLRALYRPGMNEASRVALFWYTRNRLLHDAGLHRDPRVLVVNYERLVTDPQAELWRLFDFLDLPLPGSLSRRVSPHSVRKSEPPAIETAVREECDALHADLLARAGSAVAPFPARCSGVFQ